MTNNSTQLDNIEAIRDRARGCLVGLALGDALGAPYEFKRPPFIVADTFGRGVFGTPPGGATDDSTIAEMLCRHLAEGNTLRSEMDRRKYASQLVAWADTNPPDIGTRTRQSINTWRKGGVPRFDAAAQGNGAVMACAPLGVARKSKWAPVFSQVTHNSEESVRACSLVATAVEGLVWGRGYTWCRSTAVPELTGDGVDVAGSKQGWCLLTTSLAFDALESTGDGRTPVGALMDLIALGGDTDTNAAVAGALIGAAHGMAAWPDRLVRRLEMASTMIGHADTLIGLPRVGQEGSWILPR